jgi:hypothetical protein
LSLRATGNNVTNLLKYSLPDQFLKFVHTLSARDQDDLIHAARLFERCEGVRENRFVAEQRQQLVEAHPLAASRRDDDGTKHGVTALKS